MLKERSGGNVSKATQSDKPFVSENLIHFSIKLAGQVIHIDALSPIVYYNCLQYLSNDKPDSYICLTQEDIDNEIEERTIASGHRKQDAYYCRPTITHNSSGYQLFLQRESQSFIELMAAYRKIVEELINHRILLIHGAVISIENCAYMFSAPSGTGKTTHIKKWLDKVENVVTINGDKPLIKIADIEAIACGTPWCGKERMASNVMVPLKSIVFLKRSEFNKIQKISFVQAYPLLLQQTYIPHDTEKTKIALNLITQLYGKVTFWLFHCNNYKDDCFDVAYNSLVGEKS